VRADECSKLRGKHYLGRCSAKREWFYGLRLHWVCDQYGFPIAFDLLPAATHELLPTPYLLADLPPHSLVLGDGAYLSAPLAHLLQHTGSIFLIVKRHARLKRPNSPAELTLLHAYRPVIETAHSLLEKMGLQRLQTRSLPGFILKVVAALFALACNHLLPSSN
jgi:hypothetical protein